MTFESVNLGMIPGHCHGNCFTCFLLHFYIDSELEFRFYVDSIVEFRFSFSHFIIALTLIWSSEFSVPHFLRGQVVITPKVSHRRVDIATYVTFLAADASWFRTS